MNLSWIRRRGVIVLLAILSIVAALAIAAHVALRQLAPRVAEALGPRASIGSIGLGWNGVEIRDLVLRADTQRWPAEHELRADRVRVRPTFTSLLGGRIELARITVDGGYVSLLRSREGRLVFLPSMMERGARGAASSDAPPQRNWQLRIDTLSLRDVTIELFDASVARGGSAPHRLRLTQLRADVGPLALPSLDERMTIELDSAIQGRQRTGRLSLEGQLTPATRDADLKLDARGLDLTALQPYLIKSGESTIRSGTLDLRAHAKAAQQRLHAPGRLVLHGLELDSGGGVLNTFGGVPKQAVLAAMSRDGKIELDFTLEGRVDDPKFSINELFAARFAVGLAEKLGVSLGGVVEGVGNVIKGLFGR